jgi:LysM domain-containing protein
MQITHEEARQLIQFNTDHTLPLTKRELLDSHLKECVECTSYRQDMDAVGNTLQTTMRKHWSAQVRHLDVQIIREKLQPVSLSSNFLPTRGVLVGMVVLLFVLASWQFVNSNNKPAMLVTNLSPIPTPSLLLTGTNSNLNNCQKMKYEVQQGDTLERLAQQFSTSIEAISQLNNLQSTNIQPGMKLIVPVCDPTPTRTSRTPTLTITPMLEPITYTPG